MEKTLLDLLDRIPVFIRSPEGEIVHWTRGCEDLFGYSQDEAHGQPAQTLLKTTFPEPLETILARLKDEGDWSGRLGHTTRDGRQIWTEAVWKRRETTEHGLIVVEQHTDVTSRVELEKRSALLTLELQHRVGNILSVVQALARKTFPDASAEQRRKMDERLVALAEANRILKDASWGDADLRALITQIGSGLGVTERIHLDGPDLSVSSNQAMGLALALHELGTNALKYGALSRESGHVSLTWAIEAGHGHERCIHLTWQEHGGPPVSAPSRTGFGTKLIRHAIGDSLSRVNIHYEPDGLICELRWAYHGEKS